MTEVQKTNMEHLENPEPGDYWHEMLTPICVVLGVTPTEVLICKEREYLPGDRWTWDLGKIVKMSKEDFRKWLTYDTDCSKTWCRVRPGAHKWAVDYFMEVDNGICKG